MDCSEVNSGFSKVLTFGKACTQNSFAQGTSLKALLLSLPPLIINNESFQIWWCQRKHSRKDKASSGNPSIFFRRKNTYCYFCHGQNNQCAGESSRSILSQQKRRSAAIVQYSKTKSFDYC